MKNAALALSLAFLGCAGGKPRPSASEAPSWLAEGNGVVTTEAGRQIHAIGAVSGVRDSRARRQQADQKARDQLAATMDGIFASLQKTSDASVAASIPETGRKAVAQSARIMDHWVTQDGTESALAVVELGAFKQALQDVDGDDRAKTEIANRIDRALDQAAQK